MAAEQSPKAFVQSLAAENIQLRQEILSAQQLALRAELALVESERSHRNMLEEKNHTLNDLTEENRILLGSQDFIYRIFDSSPDCIKVLDLSGNLRMMNTGGQRVMEIDDFTPYVTVPWVSFWADEHKPKVVEAIRVARTGATGRFQAPAPTAKGTPKWWDVVVTPIKDSEGRIANFLAVSRDITPERELRERQEFLMRELDHRVKNMLAVVQSIAQQTFRDESSLAEARRAFIARLGMLTRANDILLRDNWESSSLEDLIAAALAPYSDKASRFTVEGPGIKISGQATLGIALALHELATNAAKYGALSDHEGKIEIRWAVQGEGDAALFNFYWMESGGPAVVPPTKKGFGMRMIEFTVASQFKGEVRSDYRPSGLVFEIVAPLKTLQ